MYFYRPPYLLRKSMPHALWEHSGQGQVYLSFDDGPGPAMEDLLDLLSQAQVKASFFLLGEQVEKRPEIPQVLRDEGHFVGNHGYRHLDGWKTPLQAYLDNVRQGQEWTGSSVFRPPYGRMSPSQYKAISEHHQIVMWDLMPGDFDQKKSAHDCAKRIEKNVRDGSIIVLHDNELSKDKLLRFLPSTIEHIKRKGLHMESLDFLLS